MITWQRQSVFLAICFALAGCVSEEEALTEAPGSDEPPASTALSLTAPADQQAEATGTLTSVALGQATAAGGVGSYSITHDAPPEGFPLGTTAVNWSVVDGSGAAQSATQMINVADTTSPTLVMPADIQVLASGALTMVDIGLATATDLVDPNPVIDNDQPVNGFPVGTTGVRWTATDTSGNAATALQMVTVAQPSAGALQITAPANISVEATATTRVSPPTSLSTCSAKPRRCSNA